MTTLERKFRQGGQMKAHTDRSTNICLRINAERREKLKSYMTTLEQKGDPYPFKLNLNRVGSMILARAIDELESRN